MNKAQINKLKTKIKAFRQRQANIKSVELENLANALGRYRSNRGKEPTYISELLPESRPISIPNHPGSLMRYTAGNILDALEQDLFSLEELRDHEGEE